MIPVITKEQSLIQDKIIENWWLNHDRFKEKDMFEYSEAAETVVANAVEKPFNLIAENLTRGNCPSHDFDFRSPVSEKTRKTELKITGKDDFHIEYAYENGSPSGISITKSDVYLTLAGGWTGTGSRAKHVGKLRMYKTDKLKEIVDWLKTKPKFCKNYPRDGKSRGSRCVVLTKELLKDLNSEGLPSLDIGLMDIGLVLNKKGQPLYRSHLPEGRIVGYDMNDLNPCGDFRYAQSRVWKWFS